MQPRLIPQAMTVGGVAMMATLSWVALPASGQDREVAAAVPVLHAPDPALAKSGKTVVKRRSPPAKTLAPLDSASVRPGFGRPVIIATTDLMEFGQLSAGRQRLVATAIELAKNSPWLPYTFGGADPALGGLDCSGAMYYVMTKLGLAPPRTSAGQYEWLRENRRLHLIPKAASTMDHPSLAWLLPGDLLFWSTPVGSNALGVNITHVAMYLGREKKDGWQVMINATDGRSYRGTRANGYGVYDLRMPRADATSRMVGYGLPPGIPEIITPAIPPTGRQTSLPPRSERTAGRGKSHSR